MRDALMAAPSFLRSALWYMESMRCSVPARSTRVRMPSRSFSYDLPDRLPDPAADLCRT
jgi:hypothetical protein